MKRARGLAANHRQVYRALQSAAEPLTAYQILDALRPAGISAPPTVYRALSRLVEDGLAHRLETINAYVACRDPDHPHETAVFAICRDCGRIEEFVEKATVKRLVVKLSDSGFKVEDSTIEFRGLCGACADKSMET